MGATPATVGRKATERLARRVAIAMLLLGALSAYIGAATLEMSPLARAVQVGLAIGLTVFGLAIAAMRELRPWLQQTGVLWAVITVSGMLATADDFGTTPFFYLWPAVYAAYFLSAEFLVFTMLAVVGTLTGALVISAISWAVKTDILIGTTLSTGLMAGVVAVMHRREERLNDQLAEAALTDPLTGLLNRRGFDAPFEAMLMSAASSDSRLSVAIFDLDHFKRFNDDHGHMKGDEALRRMAVILRHHARPVDLIARFGGEEFVVVMPGVDVLAARSYAERVAWALGAEAVDPRLRLCTSSGLAQVVPVDTAVALLDRADRALYAAKAAGRARAAWWAEGRLEVGEPVGDAGAPGDRSVPALRPVPDPTPAPVATDAPAVPPAPQRRSA